MASEPSTRSRTRASGSFVRSTPGSHSLERGLALLRAFRLGGRTLSNAELAERTGLPRPTVSRLTRSLVDAGFLAYDHQQQGYRLGAVCLTLALVYRASERALEVALPLMRSLAEGRRVNVGLAMADQLEMVYLDSVRLSRLGMFRRIVPGSRIPIASTALGCAFLAGLAVAERKALLLRLRQAQGSGWPALQRGVEAALASVRAQGFCRAQWQAGMVSVAAPLRTPGGELYALNVSFPVPASAQERQEGEEDHVALLQRLAADIQAAWAAAAL
jgi:DNA-binding IclR family transcriptional regulator